jgi:hypothetical protein
MKSGYLINYRITLIYEVCRWVIFVSVHDLPGWLVG